MEMEYKSPVSLLQEYLIKDGVLPSYKLVLSGTGNNPTFEWEVSARGMIESGRGKSKKEAKHDAAMKLLLSLKGEMVQREKVHVELPSEKEITENAVGALYEYCAKNLVVPRYEVIRKFNKEHLNVFHIRCTVLSQSTEAQARSKKQAKQEASQLMLLKLRDTEMNLKDFNVRKIAIENEKKGLEDDKKKIVDKGIASLTIRGYPDYIKEKVLPNSGMLQFLVNADDIYIESLTNPEYVLRTILKQLDFNFKFELLHSIFNNFVCHLCIKDLHHADFIGVAISQEEAKQNAVMKALNFMVAMSK